MGIYSTPDFVEDGVFAHCLLLDNTLQLSHINVLTTPYSTSVKSKISGVWVYMVD